MPGLAVCPFLNRVTTLTNTLLDSSKMEVVRQMRWESSEESRPLCPVCPFTTHVCKSAKEELFHHILLCSRRDPLTGGSSIIAPEAKLGTAVAALFLSFFALAQVFAGAIGMPHEHEQLEKLQRWHGGLQDKLMQPCTPTHTPPPPPAGAAPVCALPLSGARLPLLPHDNACAPTCRESCWS